MNKPNAHFRLLGLREDVTTAFLSLPQDVRQDFFAEVNGLAAFLNPQLIKDILAAAKRHCGFKPQRQDLLPLLD